MSTTNLKRPMVGTDVEVEFVLTTPAGVPQDSSLPIVSILKPDGTVDTYSGAPPLTYIGVGTYSILFTVDQAGQWIANCAGTVGGVIADDEVTFFVRERRVP